MYMQRLIFSLFIDLGFVEKIYLISEGSVAMPK